MKKIRNLNDLHQEKQLLELKSQALKKQIVQEAMDTIDATKNQVLNSLGKVSTWAQVGLAGLAIYKGVSGKGNNQDAMAFSDKEEHKISDWLEIASDVAKIMES